MNETSTEERKVYRTFRATSFENAAMKAEHHFPEARIGRVLYAGHRNGSRRYVVTIFLPVGSPR